MNENKGKYKTKVLAIKKLTELQDICQKTLCPVFKIKCYGEGCLSYVPGWFSVPFEDGSHNIGQPGCSSPLVTGMIYHNQE